MANPEHLDIIKQGVAKWNEWALTQQHNLDPAAGSLFQPDLSNASFEGADLSGARFLNTILAGANLKNSNLKSANFVFADLRSANLADANITGANLQHAKLMRANLAEARLDGAKLDHSVLAHAVLEKAQLNEANLSLASLRGANLRKASLIDARLLAANLDEADLTGAKLNGAFLANVSVEDADFTEVELGYTTISGSDISKVKGLHTAIHQSPVSIGIDTIYLSKGNIPEVFLRRSGVPENFITYMHSLTGKALEFYKCFISFTEEDDSFSAALYSDLQAAGVRCWRWKEDAKWGKPLMQSIDEAVRLYDKLVVICSENSLKSPAVIREIERALQKEDELARQGKDSEVLFPIRLDDYIFSGFVHHRKADIVAKHIGDFLNWRDHETYRNALSRLVHDLRTE